VTEVTVGGQEKTKKKNKGYESLVLAWNSQPCGTKSNKNDKHFGAHCPWWEKTEPCARVHDLLPKNEIYWRTPGDRAETSYSVGIEPDARTKNS
jgi:hypothetical protein